ncbi:translation initiation factor IF-1 [Patescibacteria group bacterium]|nr:translation initiation factor IF-1 [Patescibacteria group bacterium]HOM78143.1 translation initiation factor IF-1 [bacterium]
MNKDIIQKDAVVTKTLTGGMFKVELDDTHEEVLAVISGKIRKFKIRIMPGDKVKVEFSPHDLNLGRITYRYR